MMQEMQEMTLMLPRKMLLAFAVVTFVVTFVASRGQHTLLHQRLAAVAMVLEALLALAALLRSPMAPLLAVAVAGCFLLVYVTDTRSEASRLDYTLRVLRTGWHALAGRLVSRHTPGDRVLGARDGKGR